VTDILDMRQTNKTGFFIILTALACLAAVWCGCEEEASRNQPADVAESSAPEPDQITYNAHFLLYSGGHKTTDMLADTIMQYSKLDSTVAYNLYVEFYDTSGARTSTLTSDKGYIREKDNYLAVSGSVEVVSEDSTMVKTEFLEWIGAVDSVVTDSFVTVIYPNSDTITSYGMQSDPELKNIALTRVSGKITETEESKNEED